MLIPLRRSNPHALFVGMIDVRMGDRIAQIGCADGGRLGAVAGKVGLSGRAVALVMDDASAARAAKGAAQAGALVDVERATLTCLPVEDSGFDLVIVDETDGAVARIAPEARSTLMKEILRILRAGGRVMVVGAAPRGGIGEVLSRAQQGPAFEAEAWLEAEGFKAVRRLAEREHLIFVEALQPAPRRPEP